MPRAKSTRTRKGTPGERPGRSPTRAAKTVIRTAKTTEVAVAPALPPVAPKGRPGKGKRSEPAEGTCRWVRVEFGTWWLEINVVNADGEDVRHIYLVTRDGKDYLLWRTDEDDRKVVLYRVRTKGGPAWWRCDCPDATTGRQGGCKHIMALKARVGDQQ